MSFPTIQLELSDRIGVEMRNKINEHFSDASQHSGGGAARVLVFRFEGNLTPRTTGKLSLFAFGTLGKIKADADDAPTGTAAIFQVLKNGSNAGSPFQIAAGANVANVDNLGVSGVEDDEIQVSCTQIGATNPGSGVSVQIEVA
jgi:hypothetical protein